MTRAVKPRLRPSTWANYRTYIASRIHLAVIPRRI